MNKGNNPLLTRNAQKLRKNMTKEEKHLWYDFLKSLPVNVNRRKTFGRYILDFYCASAKVAIDVDGSQHYEDTGKIKDNERDNYLAKRGIRVLRYSNREINLYFSEVCADIKRNIL